MDGNMDWIGLLNGEGTGADGPGLEHIHWHKCCS
jgi:hypothetical protein